MNLRSYSITQIAQWIQADAHLPCPDRNIKTLAYDTRLLNHGRSTLFFAFRAARDGHAYIPQAYALGVRDFVVAQDYSIPERFNAANFLKVPDTLQAIQRLAEKRRKQYKGTVLGITGSNGKTVVKEWLYQMLRPDMQVYRSPKSYNSQLGVALALWDLDDQAELCIIEAGISQPGEMKSLAGMIAADQGILTNIKQAHLEGFPDKNALALEKIQLFKQVKQLVYATVYLPEITLENHPEIFTWGNTADRSLQLLETVSLEQGTRIRGLFKGAKLHIDIPFRDAASVENAIICWCYLLQMGLNQKTIMERMLQLTPLQMRLQLKHGLYQTVLIDDAYSFDLASLSIALQFLYQQSPGDRRVVILSDLPGLNESKQAQQKAYQTLAELVSQKKLYRFIGIGKQLKAWQTLFSFTDAMCFTDTRDFLENFNFKSLEYCTLLIKGARVFEFERITARLSLQTHETRVEIDLNALSHNLKQIRTQLPRGTRIMGMVKAFSYGSGSYEIAGQLQYDQIDYLGVAYIDEAVALRRHGIRLPIMVMHPDPQYFDIMIARNLEPEIYSYSILERLYTYGLEHGIQHYPIHIKIESGMHRLGFSQSELLAALKLLKSQQVLQVCSVFSHLASAPDAREDTFTRQQIQLFSDTAARIKTSLGYPFMRHIANSAGIERFPEAHFDMVRTGINLYGGTRETTLDLQSVLHMKTQIAQVKTINPGDTVGYNRHGVLKKGGQVATVKIGYADGYDRRLGNGVAYMRIGAYRAPTLGDICMDMCMLDISGLPVKAGDEVIVFGEDPHIADIAAAAGMIPYELLTGISQRVKRIYLHG